MCFLTFFLHLIISFYLPFDYLITWNIITIQDFFKYLAWFLISGFGVRCLYYGTWYLSESQSNLCYMGFKSTSNEIEDWSHFQNANAFKHEMSTNLKEGFDSWNTKTAVWLRKIVYDQVSSNKVLCTFFVSAFWHGWYPHYYHTFAFGAIFTHISRMGRKKIRPLFLNTPFKVTYDLVTAFLTKFLLTYHTLAHATLDFQKSYLIWRKLYFFGHLAIVGLLLKYV
uniref:Membrane-bound O-acyltransferase domain-containing protein 2 (Trinotate prediction) n=1 Tax=Myxobolus squamalis TaxID=59785 RepID=A0A6B2FXB1_MYXSQ